MPRRELPLAISAISLPLVALLLAAAQSTITICHHPSALEDPFLRPVTKTISVSALQGHLKHGDTIGPCTAEPTPRPTPRPTPQPTPRVTPQPTPRPTASPQPTATTTPSIAPPPPSGSPVATIPPSDTLPEEAVLELVRRARGDSIPVSSTLMVIAKRRAHEIVTNFSHDGRDHPYAEVLAWNSYPPELTVAVAVDQWLDSAGHRAVLLGDWAHIGVGVAQDDYQHFYAVVLGNFGPSLTQPPTDTE